MFIAFDGMDGTGKSTQVEVLAKRLTNEGKKVQVLNLGKTMYFYEILQKINSKELLVPAEIREMIYYFEGLYANLNYVKPNKADDIVIIDRYYLSYYAYGVGNGLPVAQISFFTKNLIEPDLYFFLDSDAKTTCNRIKKYRGFDPAELGYQYNTQKKSDKEIVSRFLEFQNMIHDNYISHLKPNHIVIDATKSIDFVSRSIWDVVKTMV